MYRDAWQIRPDIPARPVEVLREEVARADTALREADHRTVIQILGGTIGELCVHGASGDGLRRTAALRLLVQACGSDGTIRPGARPKLGEQAQRADDHPSDR
jgi:hypothetical protein